MFFRFQDLVALSDIEGEFNYELKWSTLLLYSTPFL